MARAAFATLVLCVLLVGCAGMHMIDLSDPNQRAKLGQALGGGVIGGAVGAVVGLSSMAASGGKPDVADAASQLWAGVLSGALTGYGLDKQFVDPKDKSVSLSSEKRRAHAMDRMQLGAVTGVIGGSFTQLISGSSDEGGSSASSRSVSGSSGGEEENDNKQQSSAAQSAANLPVVHNAVAGAAGAGAVGYVSPELLLLGTILGDGVKKVSNNLNKDNIEATTAQAKDTAMLLGGAAVSAIGSLKDKIAKKSTGVSGGVDATLTTAGAQVNLAVDKAGRTATSLVNDATQQASLAIDKAGRHIGTAIDSAGRAASTLVDSAGTKVDSALDSAGRIANQVTDTIGSNVDKGLKMVKAKVQEVETEVDKLSR